MTLVQAGPSGSECQVCVSGSHFPYGDARGGAGDEFGFAVAVDVGGLDGGVVLGLVPAFGVAPGWPVGQRMPFVRVRVALPYGDARRGAGDEFGFAVAVDVGGLDGGVVLGLVPAFGVAPEWSVGQRMPGVRVGVVFGDDYSGGGAGDEFGFLVAVDVGGLDGGVVLGLVPVSGVVPGWSVGQRMPGVRVGVVFGDDYSGGGAGDEFGGRSSPSPSMSAVWMVV
jgi:hypothetical protein